MRKTNKTLKVTRSIVLLLCCIIFFSSFSAVYALGLGKHNNVWDNLGDDLGGSQTDTYPYNRIGQADWSGTIKSVGMDVLYGTTHGIVLYYGEVPHDETFNKDKRIDAWNGYPYREKTSISSTKDGIDPYVYWGTKLEGKSEVTIEDLENVNTSDKIVSMRLYALSVSPTQFGFWLGNIFYIVQVFFAGLGTKIINLLVIAKNIDMAFILENLGLEKLSEVANKAFIWNPDAGSAGQISIFTAFCILIFLVSIVGYAISYARGTKKTMDIKEVLVPVFVGLIIIGMCLTGRINTLGSALSNGVTKVCNAIAGIATDSSGGSVFITDVSGDPNYENRCIQIQEMSLVNKCFIDMQICTQFGVSGIGKLNMISLPNGSSNTQYLKYDKSLDFNTEFGNNLGYYYWFADSNAADKTNKNITYPKTSPTANEEKMSSMITFLQACYNSASTEGQKESIRNIVYSFAKPHTMIGALRMFLFFGIMVVLALCLWRYVKDILVAKLKMLLALLGMAVAGPLMITGKPKLVQTGKDILGIIIISFIEITIHSIMFDAILFAVGIVISPDLLRLVVTFFLILLLWHFNKKLNEQIHKATESVERSVISSNGIVAQAKRSAHNYLRDRPARWLEERARRYDEGSSANGKSHAGNLRSRMLHLAADSASANGKGFTKITAESIKARKKSNAEYDRERLREASDKVKEIETEMNKKITDLNDVVNNQTKDQIEAAKNDQSKWTEEEVLANSAAYKATFLRDAAGEKIQQEMETLSQGSAGVKAAYDTAKLNKDANGNVIPNVDENGNCVDSEGKVLCTKDEFDEYQSHMNALKEAREDFKKHDKKVKEEKQKFDTSIENRVKATALAGIDSNIINEEDKAAIQKKIDEGQDISSAISSAVQESRKEGYAAALKRELDVANELSDKKLEPKKIGGAKRVNTDAVETANVATLKMAQLKAGVKVSSTDEAKTLMKSITEQTVKNNQFDVQNNEFNKAAQEAATEIKNAGKDYKDQAIKDAQGKNIVARGAARVGGTAVQAAVAAPDAVIGTGTAATGAIVGTAQETGKAIGNAFKADISVQNAAASESLAEQIVKAQKSGIDISRKANNPDELKAYVDAAKNAQQSKKDEIKAQKAAEKEAAKQEAANKAAEEKARRDAEKQAQAQVAQQRAAEAQAAAQARVNTQQQPPTPIGVAAAAVVPTVANATQTSAKPAASTPTQAAPVTKPQSTPTVTQSTSVKPAQSIPDPIKPMSQIEAERAAAAAQKAAQTAQSAAATSAQYKETITNVAKNVTAQQQQNVQPTRPVQVAPAQVAPKQPTQPQRPAQAQPAVQQPVTPVTPVQQTAKPQTVQVQPTVSSQPSNADYKTAQQRAVEAQEQARARAQAAQQSTVKPQPTVAQPQVQAAPQPQVQTAPQPQQTKPQPVQTAPVKPTQVQPTQVEPVQKPKPVSDTNTDQRKLNNFTLNRQAQQPVDKPMTDAEKRAATLADEKLLTKAKSDEKLGFKPKDE